MADSFLGEIRLFAGSYAPNDWLFCWGQTLLIVQNQALYSVIGPTYNTPSTNSSTSFCIPDLRGCALIHQGQGVGLSPYGIAQTGGAANVTLTAATMPSHNHTPGCNTTDPSPVSSPVGAIWGVATSNGRTGVPLYDPTPSVALSPLAIGSVGGGQAHNNMQPFVAINFIISMAGEYPFRPQ